MKNTQNLRKIIFFLMVSVLFFGQAWALENNSGLSLEKIFENIQAKNKNIFGEKTTAEISSALIKIQLKNIPREMKELGKTPILLLKHNYGKLPRLQLENVESFYADFFVPYEDILQRSGLFLGVDNFTTLSKFTMQYIVEKVLKNNSIVEIYIKEKQGLNGNYAIFSYDENWLLKRAKFFEAKNPSAEMAFFFEKKDKKLLPQRLKMDILDPQNPTHLIVSFSNFSNE